MPTRRPTTTRRKNPSGSDFAVAHGVIEDADNHGEFYEDTVQPRLFAWAKKEAKYLLQGAAWKNRRPVPAVVWNDIVRLWAAEHGVVLTPQQVTSAGAMLRARFEPEAEGYVPHFVDELLYPMRAKPRPNPAASGKKFRLVNLRAKATLANVNDALRVLGFSPEQLSLAGTRGYYYIVGTDDAHLWETDFNESSVSGAIGGSTVVAWLYAILERLEGGNTPSEETERRTKHATEVLHTWHTTA